jgi:hypothetical protein
VVAKGCQPRADRLTAFLELHAAIDHQFDRKMDEVIGNHRRQSQQSRLELGLCVSGSIPAGEYKARQIAAMMVKTSSITSPDVSTHLRPD